MSYLDNLRGLRMLGMTLYEGKELLDEEKRFLAIALLRIARGEDANEVLRLKLGRGKKEKDVIARKRMSFILHIVECFMFPEPASKKQVMSLEDACYKAKNEIVPIAKRLYPGADKTRYTAEYIQRCNSSHDYKHMRSPLRRWTDEDFPYTE